MTRTIFTLIAISICSFFLVSCSDMRDKDTIIIGTSADNPPYEYMKDGKIEGFDADLMAAIGNQLNKKIEFKNMDFSGLLAALTTKNVDMVIAGLSITPERELIVDFSQNYLNTKAAALFRKSDEFSNMESLNGKIVGVQLGTTWAAFVKNMANIHKFEVKTLGNNLMLVEELKAGRIDAIIVELSQTEKFKSQNTDFASFAVTEHNSSFAIALPKHSPYKEKIDSIINVLKNNGTIRALARKWDIEGAN